MITLKSIAALFIDTYSGGDASKDSRLSYQILVPRIRHILNDFIKPLMLERYNEDDRTPPSNYVVQYELTVQNDALGAYCDLPEWYLSLPHNKGIWRLVQRIPVSSQPGQYADFEFVPTQFPQINQNTRAGRYPTHKKYYAEGQRLRLQNVYAEPDQSNKVIAQIICGAPSSLGENDNIPLSPETVSQVLLKLTAFLSPVPQDKLNNGQPIPNV